MTIRKTSTGMAIDTGDETRYYKARRHKMIKTWTEAMRVEDWEQADAVLFAHPHIAAEEGADSPLFLAVSLQNFRMAAALLCLGAPVNQRDAEGRTPLMVVVSSFKHNPLMAVVFLAFGADPALADYRGRTAQEYAVDCSEQIRALLRRPVYHDASELIPRVAACVASDEGKIMRQLTERIGRWEDAYGEK